MGTCTKFDSNPGNWTDRPIIDYHTYSHGGTYKIATNLTRVAVRGFLVNTSPWTTVPFRMWELHGGKVAHDSNVDEALGILHDAEDGLEVLSPACCTERWRGTLTVTRDDKNGKQARSVFFSPEGHIMTLKMFGTTAISPIRVLN